MPFRPSSESEIADALEAGTLSETHIFDAKRQLPAPGKNVDLAIDVCAMTVDGGVLLYGVGENEHGVPTQLAPIELKGVRERISQVVSTSIEEAPFVESDTINSEDDSSCGYVVVNVPKSPRAPHMVVVRGDCRYYGRDATGNRILTEGDVARLYSERRKWEANRDALLEEAISESMRFEPLENVGYLVMYAQPVAGPTDMLREAAAQVASSDERQCLERVLHHGRNADLFPVNVRFHTVASVVTFERKGADAWVGRDVSGSDSATSEYVLELHADRRGQLRLLSGGVARDPDGRGVQMMLEGAVAENVVRFLAVAGELYARAGFVGMADVGLAVLNIESAQVEHATLPLPSKTYDAPDYRRTARVVAAELSSSPTAIARGLVQSFVEAFRGRGVDLYDPAAWDHR